jgi:hypothetical protein
MIMQFPNLLETIVFSAASTMVFNQLFGKAEEYLSVAGVNTDPSHGQFKNKRIK